ncbi:uncharacterized protein LOC122852519 [Aphidius gifuensis]|uniref:uncharacterized protein LOC122852519 n=1 Tax=Aphidius gifuensis TaxID=684658 RepID=UPI001CDCACFC|nr:uncharacterized protein LOC122852519 [Aphidius gifuensis]
MRGLIFIFLTSLSLAVSSDVEKKETFFDCLSVDLPVECVVQIAKTQFNGTNIEDIGKKYIGNFNEIVKEVVDGAKSFLTDDTTGETEVQDESRKHKFGKKKKKMLAKLMPIFMLVKAKLSLLLQMISTHFQIKFFKIAVISLIVNIARFWIDLKKSHQPDKIVYYEHAHHQHHYDPEDHGDYWRRSTDNEYDNNLAYNPYNGWAPSEDQIN